MIKLVIVDDHDLFRSGLCRLIESEQDLEVVGESGTGKGCVELCREVAPDILLLDLDLPDMDGFEVTKQINELGLKVKIIVLTMHTSEEYAVRLFKIGVSGFMIKCISARELPGAIRQVMAGETYIPEDMKDTIIKRLLKISDKEPLSLLSDRELQILTRLANGEEIKNIAANLGLSPRTVETHKARGMKKLKLSNMVEMAHFFLRHGLVNKL